MNLLIVKRHLTVLALIQLDGMHVPDECAHRTELLLSASFGWTPKDAKKLFDYERDFSGFIERAWSETEIEESVVGEAQGIDELAATVEMKELFLAQYAIALHWMTPFARDRRAHLISKIRETWCLEERQDCSEIAAQLREFASERDWEQYHSPKNLASALIVEAAELLEIFQWLTPGESSELDTDQQLRAEEELADVFNYVIRLADILGIDLVQASKQKIQENAIKYPANIVRGSAKKYTEFLANVARGSAAKKNTEHPGQ